MFYPYKDGTSKEIGYDGLVYKVHFPPEGYVFNKLTGEMEKTKILFSELSKERQIWRRTELPSDYRKKRNAEISKQEITPEFVDNDLEEFRKQEWYRRLNGVWVSINGSPIYLTGMNYFYLNWWELYFGTPKFRYIDTEFFWFWQYVCENPLAYGCNIVGARQIGKSAKGGVILFEQISRELNNFSGFQSKEKEEAKTNFKKYVVDPFLKLPDFFRPEYQQRNQLVTSIPFVRTLETSKNFTRNDEVDLGLNSTIQVKASGEGAFDSQTLNIVWLDEGGKREDTDIDVMWTRTKPTMYNKQTGHIRGKAYLCTTIEELNNVNPFIELWDKSSFKSSKYKLQSNGQTVSGLINYFIPADVSRRVDDYGFPLREESLIEIQALREGITDMKTLYEIIRKDPLTVKEAMDSAKSTNPFNMQIINEVYEQLFHKSEEVKGNLSWVEKDKTVRWTNDNINGKWHTCWFLPEALQNNYDTGYSAAERILPKNCHRFFMACDPVKSGNSATSKQKSSIATTVYRRDMDDDDCNNNFIAYYLHRPDDPEEAYEDMIMACIYFGTKVLIEKLDSTHMVTYFEKRGYGNLIADTPDALRGKNKFIESKNVNATVDSIGYSIGGLRTWINNRGRNLKLRGLVEQFKGYSPEHRTKFDLVVAAGFTIIQVDVPFVETQRDTDMLKVLAEFGYIGH